MTTSLALPAPSNLRRNGLLAVVGLLALLALPHLLPGK